jgi:hypothetical protein
MRAGLAAIATMLALALTSPAFAEKPADAGQGRGKGQGRGGPPGQMQPGHGQPGYGQPAPAPRGSASVSVTIGAPDQLAIRQYYGQQATMGHCPPGLAKKHNGCMPPGLAKKWVIGQPLPAGVAYFALPAPLLGRLTPAPAGYLYVQVGPDVLLMGAATRMIVSAVAIF